MRITAKIFIFLLVILTVLCLSDSRDSYAQSGTIPQSGNNSNLLEIPPITRWNAISQGGGTLIAIVTLATATTPVGWAVGAMILTYQADSFVSFLARGREESMGIPQNERRYTGSTFRDVGREIGRRIGDGKNWETAFGVVDVAITTPSTRAIPAAIGMGKIIIDAKVNNSSGANDIKEVGEKVWQAEFNFWKRLYKRNAEAGNYNKWWERCEEEADSYLQWNKEIKAINVAHCPDKFHSAFSDWKTALEKMNKLYEENQRLFVQRGRAAEELYDSRPEGFGSNQLRLGMAISPAERDAIEEREKRELEKYDQEIEKNGPKLRDVAKQEYEQKVSLVRLCMKQYKVEWPVPISKEIADWEKLAQQLPDQSDAIEIGKIQMLSEILDKYGTMYKCYRANGAYGMVEALMERLR